MKVEIVLATPTAMGPAGIQPTAAPGTIKSEKSMTSCVLSLGSNFHDLVIVGEACSFCSSEESVFSVDFTSVFVAAVSCGDSQQYKHSTIETDIE